MTGKGSIHKHGSSGCEVAGNLSAKFPGDAVNRSFNALARGQFLQACPQILVGRADYFIASEVSNNRFLLAPPDDALLSAVLVKLFADRQLAVGEGVIAYLLPRMERSLAAARETVAKLDAAALSRGRAVNRQLAAEIFRQE